MKRRNVGNAIVQYLCSIAAAFPGKTLGDIEAALRLHRGTATHQRMTEKREQGFDIRSHKIGEEWRYYILRAHATKYLALLAERKAMQSAAKGMCA